MKGNWHLSGVICERDTSVDLFPESSAGIYCKSFLLMRKIAANYLFG
jgi:hypothetical protein